MTEYTAYEKNMEIDRLNYRKLKIYIIRSYERPDKKNIFRCFTARTTVVSSTK